jgi:hypothetical protein
MELKFAHFADYAAEDRLGKLIIGGIFDQITATTPQRPIVAPAFWLVAQLEAHVTEGTDHQLELRATNADGQDIAPGIQVPVKFTPQGPGRPLRARVLANIGNFPFPDVGGYSFHLLVDGRHVAEATLQVVAAQKVG